MDFRQLRYVLSVYKERSFTKAAKRLNISQSAVSEQVKLLEEEIGFELFELLFGHAKKEDAAPVVVPYGGISRWIRYKPSA